MGINHFSGGDSTHIGVSFNLAKGHGIGSYFEELEVDHPVDVFERFDLEVKPEEDAVLASDSIGVPELGKGNGGNRVGRKDLFGLTNQKVDGFGIIGIIGGYVIVVSYNMPGSL